MKYYEQLVERMTTYYRNQTGFTPDQASEVMLRIRILAAQLDSYCQEAEEAARQSSPFTATGEALEHHAALRGLSRKEGAKATGVVLFRRSSPAGYDISIPAGTVLQSTGAEALRYVTVKDVVMLGHMDSALSIIEAVEPGARYNLRSGAITVMVTPPAGITEVVQSSDCHSGTDPESDEELRHRLIDACRYPAVGVNAGFYRGLLLAQSGVGKVKVLPTHRGSGTVDAVVYGKGEALPEDRIAALQQLLRQQRDLGIDAVVRQAVTTPVNLELEVAAASGWEQGAVAERCREAITAEMAELEIGEPWLLARMSRLLMSLPGVYNCRVTLPVADAFPLEDRLLVPGGITIREMEVQV